MARKSNPKPNKQLKNLLSSVDEEHAFWCNNGTILRNMNELAINLTTMSDDVYGYHVNADKNDFSNWVKHVIHDDYLAERLLEASSRAEAAELVIKRLEYLGGR